MVILIELGHANFCKIKCTLSEDTDQPVHPCSVISLYYLDSANAKTYEMSVFAE